MSYYRFVLNLWPCLVAVLACHRVLSVIQDTTVVSQIIFGCRSVARLSDAICDDCDVYKTAAFPASRFLLPISYQSCTRTVEFSLWRLFPRSFLFVFGCHIFILKPIADAIQPMVAGDATGVSTEVASYDSDDDVGEKVLSSVCRSWTVVQYKADYPASLDEMRFNAMFSDVRNKTMFDRRVYPT